MKFFTLLPKTNEKVMFTDCANIPYEIKLSDPENFYVDDRSREYYETYPIENKITGCPE